MMTRRACKRVRSSSRRKGTLTTWLDALMRRLHGIAAPRSSNRSTQSTTQTSQQAYWSVAARLRCSFSLFATRQKPLVEQHREPR